MNRSSVPFSFGLILAVLGSVLLVDNVTGTSYWRSVLPFWPVILLFMSLWTLIRGVFVARTNQDVNAGVWIGEIVFVILVLIFGLLAVNLANWRQSAFLAKLPLVQSAKVVMDRSVNISAKRTVSVEANAADIQVRSGNIRRARIKVVGIGAGVDNKAAASLARSIRPSLKQTLTGDINLIVDDQTAFSVANFGFPRAKIFIRVPRKVNIAIEAAAGDITIANLGGKAKIATESGDVNLYRIDGSVAVATESGDIKATDIGGRLNLAAENGDISISNRQKLTRELKITAQNGDVSLVFNERSRISIDASSQMGSIGENLRGSVSESNFGERFSASLNGGGPLISLATQNGDINLRAF